jgi:hypothetical protein
VYTYPGYVPGSWHIKYSNYHMYIGFSSDSIHAWSTKYEYSSDSIHTMPHILYTRVVSTMPTFCSSRIPHVEEGLCTTLLGPSTVLFHALTTDYCISVCGVCGAAVVDSPTPSNDAAELGMCIHLYSIQSRAHCTSALTAPIHVRSVLLPC